MEVQEDDPKSTKRHTSSWRTRSMLITILVALISLPLIYVLLAGVWQRSPECATHAIPSPKDVSALERSYTCGNTTTSAQANNCTFDPLSFAWLPKPCFDDHLSQAFLWLRNWTWYFDPDGSNPAPYEEVLKGEHDRLYVTAEHHVLHCMYMWRKMHRAVSEGWLIDGIIGDFEHADYCERMMVIGLETGGVVVVDEVVEMKWPDCPVIW
jgi:hypothetical protein